MSTPARFSDEGYKNWFKSSESLHMMKEAMHYYTDNGVTKLYGDITKKVSSIPCASSSRKKVCTCSSWDIKWTEGNPGNWSITCKNCNKWVQCILSFHVEPGNRSINWKNADMSKWHTDCYQVAKIFMPKGQQNTKTMPDDLDAPAILSLLKYCKWFRKDLPNTKILSDLIDFGSKVRHSGFRKVSDCDKDKSIKLMIQLLRDLKIPGDAISEIEMLRDADIDISYREKEIRLLLEMVSGLVSDISTVKEDMTTMESSVSDLSEKMEQGMDRTAETIGKVDAMNKNMEGIRKSLKELQVIYDKMVSFFDKNKDIYDKEITAKIQTIGTDVTDLQSNLTRVETQLQEINKRLSFLEEKVEGMDERLAAVEKHVTETTRNEIPDSEDLRKLKTCGVPEFSSDNPIHQSRSSNAVLEGTGDKYNNTSNLISSMSSISLQDTKYVLKEHFDACIIYCEDDEDDAYIFKDHIEKLDLGHGEHPKICLYTEEKVWGPTKLTERAMFVCKHCTLIFVYLSKRSSLDEYAYFFRNEVVMATIKNSRVRPVLSEKDCIIPCGLYNAPRIEFYKQESRSYKENILSLFVMNKPERLRREAKSEESILSTL